MMRTALVLGCLVQLSACFESHDAADQVIAQRDCYLCHKAEYDETGLADGRFPMAPVHSTSQCNTECWMCHTTKTWPNGLGGCVHPETAFPLVASAFGPSPHRGVSCLDCHSAAIGQATGATSKMGANTDCIACHPNTSTQEATHQGITYEAPDPRAGQPYAYSTEDHRFCLDCHPDGLVHGHGPTNQFRLPHHGASCQRCHDYPSQLGHANGADVRCVTSGCHDGNGSDRAHCADPGHRPGCLNSGCHPDGRKHDGDVGSCPPKSST
jgi:hypothetical protein